MIGHHRKTTTCRAKQEVEKETRLVSGRYEDKLEALRREMEQHDMKSFIDAASRVAAQLRAAIAQKETALKNEMAAMQAQHEGRLREALADAGTTSTVIPVSSYRPLITSITITLYPSPHFS